MVGLVALTVLLGGVVQIAFGLLGLGTLMRYVPRPVVAGFLNGIARFLPALVLPALLLGLVGALESLLGCTAIDSLTGTRHHAARELIGQGAGNAVSALFGSIFAAGSVPRTMASFRAGGRTRVAGVLTSAVLLLVVVALAPLMPPIPRVVIAALIVTVGIAMLDGWTIGLLAKLLRRVRGGWPALREEKAIAVDLAVTLAVAATTVVLSLAAAVALGMVIASALFLAKIGKAIIRRRYRGDQVHSRKVRVRPLTEILEAEGWRIAVYELQGALFFGSAENLAREVEDSATTFTHCILDLALVTELDSTGASSLVDLDRRLAQAGVRLSLSHVEPGLPLWQVFESMEVLDAIGREDCYSDTDTALEAAEEALLAQLTHLGDVGVPISLDQMEITEGLAPTELAALGARLCLQTYQRGALEICEGATDRALYFLTRGTISVGSRSQEGQHTRRLCSFTAGVVFGEMAMLDGKPRSADVWAEEDAEMLCLSFQEFERLQTQEPAVAVKLTLNLTKAIARNLRRASREIVALSG